MMLGKTEIYLLSCLASLAGLLWAFRQWTNLKARSFHLPDERRHSTFESSYKIDLARDIAAKIKLGTVEFLQQEYFICGLFVLAIFVLLSACIEVGTALSFLLGALTSIASGTLGMLVATTCNSITTVMAVRGLADSFRTAYQAGSVIGFSLVSGSLLILTTLILVFQKLVYPDTPEGIRLMFEAVAGFGLGGSTVALFGRVGGGIFTKAADVGADLVGKLESQLPEDSPANPATIADNVGDNVGDVAGMSADLFGSFAEASCAAMVICSQNMAPLSFQFILLPLVVFSAGILACIVTNALLTECTRVQVQGQVQPSLKRQLVWSSFLLAEGLAAVFLLDSTNIFLYDEQLSMLSVYACLLLGLGSGLIIGWYTQFVTSYEYSPVRELADSCNSGAATNIIFGLSLGYLSTAVPVLLIAVLAAYANYLLQYYGVALAALGMLSNLPICLAIDSFGPIADNAGGIAEMALMNAEVRARADALDAAGNTTAAIGKGFAIGSAALVGLALYGAFLSSSGISKAPLPLDNSLCFSSLLVGAMLPYLFSALTMKAVGKAAFSMVREVRRQLKQEPRILTLEVEPDYKACIQIATRESLKEMILPGCIVLLSPTLAGLLLGPAAVAGLLPGALISGVQLAISAANSGGAWDNAKKYIEAGQMVVRGVVVGKGSEAHRAAVVGDTVGDPLKDTSGPSLNILIKLMAITSLVLARTFARLHPV